LQPRSSARTKMLSTLGRISWVLCISKQQQGGTKSRRRHPSKLTSSGTCEDGMPSYRQTHVGKDRRDGHEN
jgi:hypothetical protein